MSSPEDKFARIRARARRGIVTEALALVATSLIGFMLISFVLDYSLRLEVIYRVVLLAIFVGAVIVLVRRHLLAPMSVALNDDEIALALERGEIDLSQALISAVQFERSLQNDEQPGNESAAMMELVVRDVHDRVDRVRDASALDVGRVRKFAAIVLACLGVVVTWGALYGPALSLWAQRNLLMSSVDWPRDTLLAFHEMGDRDGVVGIGEGDDLSVVVMAKGVVPEQVVIHYEFKDGSSGKEPMVMSARADADGAGHRFTWLLMSVMFEGEIWATGGDGLTRKLEIKLIQRPSIHDLKITKTFPAYMQLEPETIGSTEGDIKIPMGAKLTIEGRSSKLLSDAYMTFITEDKQAFELSADKLSFTGSITPKKSGVLTLDVTGADGYSAASPPKLYLRVVKDQPPTVDYRTEGVGSMIVYKAKVPAILKILDDFGIQKIVTKLRITGGDIKPPADGKELPFKEFEMDGLRQPDQEHNEIEMILDNLVFDLLSRNNLAVGANPPNPILPGMLVQIQVAVTDNFGPGEAHVRESEIITLRIVTQDKLMDALRRRQSERRRELKQILAKERVHRDNIRDMFSPTDSSPRAKIDRLKFLAIAREQRALRRQVQGLARRYGHILDEYLNNRLMKPAHVATQRRAIQAPLENLVADDFPATAEQVDDFARSGQEDIRRAAIVGYDSIIQVMEQVIKKMAQLESISEILEALENVKRAEKEVKGAVERKAEDEDSGAKAKKPEKRDPK